MQYLDARRLTGPSLLFDVPAALLDIACDAADIAAFEPLWRREVSSMCATMGWPAPQFAHLPLAGGASFAFTAEIDQLYAASAINEWAWAVADAQFNGVESPDREAALAAIRAALADEINPAMRALKDAAAANGVFFLWDDDDVSLGSGRTAETFAVSNIPAPDTIDWSGFERVPAALVTGTNGKTTTVRLATHILRTAGNNVGLSSTDWIAVNDRIIDRGDWSGPGGARAVLRQTDVDVAILESARGGLLRRGLGVEHADAALITNIAEDHLGDFGSRSLDELLDIKWIVSRAVREHGVLILNADDQRLVSKARQFDGDIVWFSLDEQNDTLRNHVAAGGRAFVLHAGELVQLDAGRREAICRAADIPITLGGAARHNTANALAAAALTQALGASIDEVRKGLTSMSQDSNPGRCNVYEVNGRKVLVDFAHNPHAMQALFDMARALPAKRRALCFGQAGDRPDALIRDMTRDAWQIGLDLVVVSELAEYHRGREHGDVFAVIRDEMLKQGAADTQIKHFEQESESLAAALEWAEEGDLVIMLALGGSAPVHAQLEEMGAVSASPP